MKIPAAVFNEFDQALQEMLVRFHRLAKFDPDRAAQEAMATVQMMHEYLLLEGALEE